MHPLTRELIALCRHVGLAERDVVCCDGVSIQQCTALQRLLDEPLDVSSLGAALGITVSASTRLIDGMHRRGWIARERDPHDRRRVLIQLSDEGREQALKLQTLTDTMVSSVMDHVPAEKHAQVIESVQLILTALDRAQGALGCCPPSKPG